MDGQSPSADLGVQRHNELWFEDGNVVLVAGTMGFKVHRSVLAKRATVFKDLFVLGSPDGNETLDGVPVVHLHDSAYDLADLLDVIYNGSRFFTVNQPKQSFPLVQSLVRLGSKYQNEDLRDQALNYLQQILPADITLWDQAEADPPVVYDSADIISMVNLTHELDLGAMHMRALYKCCQLPTRLLVQGARQAGRGAPQQLAPALLVACLDGRTRLTSLKRSMMEDVTWFWDQGLCEAEDRECKALQKALARRRHSAMWVLDAHPLQPLEMWLKDINPGEVFGSRLCVRCKERQAKFIQMRRIRIFGRLKECFEVTQSVAQDVPSSPNASP